jgi:hypothetical protein
MEQREQQVPQVPQVPQAHLVLRDRKESLAHRERLDPPDQLDLKDRKA